MARARYESRPSPGTGTATLTIRSVGGGEELTHFLHVFPDVALAVGTPQADTPGEMSESGWRHAGMDAPCRADARLASSLPISACAANVPSATMTRGWIRSICRNRNGWHSLDFVRLGVAIARRPALDHVRDVHIRPRQADRFDDLGEQLPRASDERLALDVFIRARRLADEHEPRLRDCPRRTPPACGPACGACSACMWADVLTQRRKVRNRIERSGLCHAICHSNCRRGWNRRRRIRVRQRFYSIASRSRALAPRADHARRRARRAFRKTSDDRRRRAGRSSRTRRRSDVQECFHAVENRFGHVSLGHQSPARSTPSAPTIVTWFVVTSNPEPGAVMSLATMRSTRFRFLLSHEQPAQGRPSARRSRPAPDAGASPRRVPSSARMSGVRSRSSARPDRLSSLASLRTGARREIGHGGRHDDDVGAIGLGHDGRVHFRRAPHAHDRADARRIDRRRTGDQCHGRAASRPLPSQSQSPCGRSIDCR